MTRILGFKTSYVGWRRRPRQGFGIIRLFASWSQIAAFICCAISLALDVDFFYCAISLPPVQNRVSCNTEVTQNSPCANTKFYMSLDATLVQARAFHGQQPACLLVQTDCDYRYALNRHIPRKCLQASCF